MSLLSRFGLTVIFPLGTLYCYFYIPGDAQEFVSVILYATLFSQFVSLNSALAYQRRFQKIIGLYLFRTILIRTQFILIIIGLIGAIAGLVTREPFIFLILIEALMLSLYECRESYYRCFGKQIKENLIEILRRVISCILIISTVSETNIIGISPYFIILLVQTMSISYAFAIFKKHLNRKIPSGVIKQNIVGIVVLLVPGIANRFLVQLFSVGVFESINLTGGARYAVEWRLIQNFISPVSLLSNYLGLIFIPSFRKTRRLFKIFIERVTHITIAMVIIFIISCVELYGKYKGLIFAEVSDNVLLGVNLTIFISSIVNPLGAVLVGSVGEHNTNRIKVAYLLGSIACVYLFRYDLYYTIYVFIFHHMLWSLFLLFRANKYLVKHA